MGQIVKNFEDKTFIDRRKEFCNYALIHFNSWPYCKLCGTVAHGKILQESFPDKDGKTEQFQIQFPEKLNPKTKVMQPFCEKCQQFTLICYSLPRFYEFNPQCEALPEGTCYDGMNFDPMWNLRDIFLDELVLEFEKGKSWDENINAFWATVISLRRWNIHFAVFFAQNMRAPHIHIYNLFPNVQDWAEKELVAILFARKVVPMEYFHLLDTSLFGEHAIALEFAVHWRTGTMNKLLFEYTPGEDNAK